MSGHCLVFISLESQHRATVIMILLCYPPEKELVKPKGKKTSGADIVQVLALVPERLSKLGEVRAGWPKDRQRLETGSFGLGKTWIEILAYKLDE